MAKFHISEDGKARECHANIRECRLVHGNSPEEATKMHEQAMAASTFATTSEKASKKIALTPAQVKENMRQVAEAVDRSGDWDEYYAATDQKHFYNKKAPGSKFTDSRLTKIEDVVSLAMEQRGSLDGDDRDQLIARGAAPTAFRDGSRYLMVKTEGSLGVKDSKELQDDDLVEITRTKPGTPVNLVRKVLKQDKTDYGVIVMTTDFQTGKPRVITTFPGTVTLSPKNNRLEALEGKTITVAQARSILGGDFYTNTRVVDSSELNKNAPAAKPNEKYGFDTSRLSPQQVKLVEARVEKMLQKVEAEYAIKQRELEESTPEGERSKALRGLSREKSEKISEVYQKLSKL